MARCSSTTRGVSNSISVQLFRLSKFWHGGAGGKYQQLMSSTESAYLRHEQRVSKALVCCLCTICAWLFTTNERIPFVHKVQ